MCAGVAHSAACTCAGSSLQPPHLHGSSRAPAAAAAYTAGAMRRSSRGSKDRSRQQQQVQQTALAGSTSDANAYSFDLAASVYTNTMCQPSLTAAAHCRMAAAAVHRGPPQGPPSSPQCPRPHTPTHTQCPPPHLNAHINKVHNVQPSLIHGRLQQQQHSQHESTSGWRTAA
jgi:hypothetical protein